MRKQSYVMNALKMFFLTFLRKTASLIFCTVLLPVSRCHKHNKFHTGTISLYDIEKKKLLLCIKRTRDFPIYICINVICPQTVMAWNIIALNIVWSKNQMQNRHTSSMQNLKAKEKRKKNQIYKEYTFIVIEIEFV